MNIDAWLKEIEGFHPETIKLGLERVEHIAKKLQLQDLCCPIVTVGGTNGKGSCVKVLESILSAQGYRVGAYTSPHLIKFNERIRIDNQNCADAELVAAFEEIQKVRESVPLTFFEFTTLAALWLFKNADLDVLLLEVGLGGRLDAVNIVDSDIAVITSIDFDHMDWLGKTREAIAWEKAGIFRRQKSAVIGDFFPPETVYSRASEMGATLFCMNKEFGYQENPSDWSWWDVNQNWQKLPKPSLPVQNAATALKVITLLQNRLPVFEIAIRQGLSNAKLSGRFEEFRQPYPCIIDVAHNPASAQLLAKKCAALKVSGKLLAVVGMLSDKDITNTLKPLKSIVDHWYFGSLRVARGACSSMLAASLEKIDSDNCYTYDCIIDAFRAASQSVAAEDKILVFGSFFTVAEVLTHLQERAK